MLPFDTSYHVVKSGCPPQEAVILLDVELVFVNAKFTGAEVVDAVVAGDVDAEVPAVVAGVVEAVVAGAQFNTGTALLLPSW